MARQGTDLPIRRATHETRNRYSQTTAECIVEIPRMVQLNDGVLPSIP